MSDDISRVELLDDEEATRLAAVAKIESVHGRWSLRTTLLFDPSARARAAAALRLSKLSTSASRVAANESDNETVALRVATRSALEEALDDVQPLVRHEACRALAKLGEGPSRSLLLRVAKTDEHWWVRRCAVVALAAIGGVDAIDELRGLLDDPAWRVRLAAVQQLEVIVRENAETQEKVLAPLVDAPVHATASLSYLAAQISGHGDIPRTLGAPPEPSHPLHDPDPAVVAARLQQIGPSEVAARTLIPWLADPHTTLRDQAIKRLADSGDEEAMREALHYLDEPRIPYATEALREVLHRAPWAQSLLTEAAPEPEPARPDDPPREIAIDHPDPLIRLRALDLEHARHALTNDVDPSVRRHAFGLLMAGLGDNSDRKAVAIEAARSIDPWLRTHAAAQLDPAGSDDELDALLALVRDTSPAVRAAVLDRLEPCVDLDERVTKALSRIANDRIDARRGAYVWHLRSLDPQRVKAALDDVSSSNQATEVVGLVQEIARAAGVLPMPATAREIATEKKVATRFREPRAQVERRPLGKTGLLVSRLGMSGAHDPKASVFHAAAEAGVNLFFWEPGYQQLSSFLRERRRDRDQRVIVSGTYHGDAASYERDVDTALRRLKIDQLDVFLLFWVRSRARIDNAAFDALSSLKERGKIKSFGFSTHHRDIAHEAIEAHPWEVLMVRHSAAHRGAERTLLPELARRDIGVLTFTNVCYGRLLRPVRGVETTPMSAEDCYRYTLSQEGVTACWSAPRWYREVLENVRVLDGATPDVSALASMRAHGDAVYAASQRFNAFVRQAPTASRRGVRTIALEHLDGLEVPVDIAGVEAGVEPLQENNARESLSADPSLASS